MVITVRIKHHSKQNHIAFSTNGKEKSIDIPTKADGRGSAVNGGELLFSAIAVCFCNDIYREAAKRKIEIESVEVSVSGTFGKEGDLAEGLFPKQRLLPLSSRILKSRNLLIV